VSRIGSGQQADGSGWVGSAVLAWVDGLSRVMELIGWVGSGHKKLTHGQLCTTDLKAELFVVVHPLSTGSQVFISALDCGNISLPMFNNFPPAVVHVQMRYTLLLFLKYNNHVRNFPEFKIFACSTIVWSGSSIIFVFQ